jgi:hypothetical protein
MSLTKDREQMAGTLLLAAPSTPLVRAELERMVVADLVSARPAALTRKSSSGPSWIVSASASCSQAPQGRAASRMGNRGQEDCVTE